MVWTNFYGITEKELWNEIDKAGQKNIVVYCNIPGIFWVGR